MGDTCNMQFYQSKMVFLLLNSMPGLRKNIHIITIPIYFIGKKPLRLITEESLCFFTHLEN